MRNAGQVCAVAGFIIAATVLPASTRAFSGDVDARVAAATEMLQSRGEMRNIEVLFSSVADNYITRMHQLHPEISDSRLQALKAAIVRHLSLRASDYVAGEARIYAEHFSVAELRKVTDFNKSPIGRRFADEIPVLIPELGKVQSEISSAAVHDATQELNMQSKVEKK